MQILTGGCPACWSPSDVICFCNPDTSHINYDVDGSSAGLRATLDTTEVHLVGTRAVSQARALRAARAVTVSLPEYTLLGYLEHGSPSLFACVPPYSLHVQMPRNLERGVSSSRSEWAQYHVLVFTGWGLDCSERL